MNTYLLKKVLSLISPVVDLIGIKFLFWPFYSGLGQILMFHRIVPENKTKRIHNHLSLEITTKKLEFIINY